MSLEREELKRFFFHMLLLREHLSFKARATSFLRSGFRIQARPACHGDVVYLVSDVLGDGAARVKLRVVLRRPTWAMLCGTAGGRGRRGDPMRMDREWRTSRDRSSSIIGIRDATRVGIERVETAPLEARSVPGVVRWPTKALKSVLVL